MMARSYREIVEKVLPLHKAEPERFKKFYDAVTVLLLSIQPGQSILIAEHCTQRSYDLFMDVAEMVIIEDMMHRETKDDILEFTPDRKSIRRMKPFEATKSLYSYYLKR